MEQSRPHNFRARANCVHQISSYTLQYPSLGDSSWKLAHVWGSFSHKVPWNFLKLFDNIWKVLLPKISDGIPCLFVFLRTLLWYWEPERLPTPFLIFPIFLLTPKMWFPSCSECQTLLRHSRRQSCHYPWSTCFSNFATTANFHVHRLKQIFLTCEIFLPERLLSGATMINRRWFYNY